MLNERETAFLSLMTKKLLSLGLSRDTAEHCALYFCDESVSNGTGPIELPPLHPETLTEALRILTIPTLPGSEPLEPDGYTAFCFLRVPPSSWKAAKQAAAEVFGRTPAEVDEVYSSDEYWLFVKPETVWELAAYLQSTFTEDALRWALFRRAGLLGTTETQHRIQRVFQLLGREIGEEMIRADAFQCCWLLYGLYTDPLGAIEYMLQQNMTPKDVLALIREDDVILYMFKYHRTLSNFHFQEEIDQIIRDFMNRAKT